MLTFEKRHVVDVLMSTFLYAVLFSNNCPSRHCLLRLGKVKVEAKAEGRTKLLNLMGWLLPQKNSSDD
jgi:hypothetical protein